MGTTIIVIVIGFVAYLILKPSKNNDDTVNVNQLEKLVSTLEDDNDLVTVNKSAKFAPIKQDKGGNWILNPNASFKLTLMNADESIASTIREILDKNISDSQKKYKIYPLFAEHNIKVKEIENYKKKYQQKYLNKIEELKEKSEEWETLGKKDRDDILIEFRQSAAKEIHELADCNLEILLEHEPKDISLDDELIKEYGFENIETYIFNANKLNKVRVIPNDNYSRPIFEKLCELGLAERGNKLPKEDILMTLTLKELNNIASNPEKQYRRKRQAVDYIMSSDLDNSIGDYVSLRELFKLNSLPAKYQDINLQEISDTWNYHIEEVKLLIDTYRNSYYILQDLKDKEFVKGYTIEPLQKEPICPCAKELSQKKYTKKSPPKLPVHVGCGCSLNKEYDYD